MCGSSGAPLLGGRVFAIGDCAAVRPCQEIAEMQQGHLSEFALPAGVKLAGIFIPNQYLYPGVSEVRIQFYRFATVKLDQAILGGVRSRGAKSDFCR